jgi:sulfur carrier protein
MGNLIEKKPDGAVHPMTSITIQLNGEARDCAAGLTLPEVLEACGYRPQLVVVEFNGEILPRSSWGDRAVVESDCLEVVTIVGGGS